MRYHLRALLESKGLFSHSSKAAFPATLHTYCQSTLQGNSHRSCNLNLPLLGHSTSCDEVKCIQQWSVSNLSKHLNTPHPINLSGTHTGPVTEMRPLGWTSLFWMWRFIWPRSQNYQEDSPVIHLLWRQEPKCLVQFPLYHEITWWKNPCSARIPTPALPNPSMFRAHLPHHQYAGIKILHWNNRVPALITIFKDGNSQATATSCVSFSPSW